MGSMPVALQWILPAHPRARTAYIEAEAGATPSASVGRRFATTMRPAFALTMSVSAS